MPTAMPTAFRKLTPVLIVDAIEPCLPLWTERLGFTVVATVPHGAGIGFAILVKDGIEVMYQTRASVADDVPSAAPATSASTDATGLFFEVEDLDAVARAIDGMEIVVPRRRTFYGTDEIGIREAGGRTVVFAQPIADAASPGDPDTPAVEPTGV